MRFITGDECGLLKETVPELCRPKQPQNENTIPSKPLLSTQDGVRRIDAKEEQRRARGVVDMTFTSPSKDSFAALRANGSVQLWESFTPQNEHGNKKQAFGKYSCTGIVKTVFAKDSASASSDDSDGLTEATNTPSQQHQGRPIALDSFLETNRLVAADSLGNLSILDTNATTPSVVAFYSPFAKGQQHLSYTKGSYQNNNICTAMAVDNRNGRVAVGGRERETIFLDVETGETVWKAKNLPPDPQTLLQHPVWTTALLFMNEDESSNIMVAGSAFKQVRLYDVRSSSTTRRPICYTPDGVLEHRVTALCQVNSNELVVGDAAGYLYSLDIRQLGKSAKGSMNLGRFVGPVGSIRQVVKHPSLPVIAAVGLDRMLRTYDTKTRRQLDCIYMKQRLNCILCCDDDAWVVEGDANAETRVGVECLDENDLNAQDDVQDYVDSSGDDNSDIESSGDDFDDDSSEEETSRESDASSEEEPESESEEEEDEPPVRHISKKRRT